MTRRAENLRGKTFGKLKVIGRSGTAKNGQPLWLCECECGNYIKVAGRYLKDGSKVSCGCDKIVEPHNISLSLSRLKMGNDPVENLAYSIVAVAADDYRKALKDNDEKKIKELEKFFHSEWGESLCSMDTDVLMGMLRKDAASSSSYFNI